MSRFPRYYPLSQDQEGPMDVEPRRQTVPVRAMVTGVLTMSVLPGFVACSNPSAQTDLNEDAAVGSSNSGVVIKTNSPKLSSSTSLPITTSSSVDTSLEPEDVGFQDPELSEALKQSFRRDFPHVELVSGPIRLSSEVGLPKRGIPNWPKRYTPGWDFEKAGNTDRMIGIGSYCIEIADVIKTDLEKVPVLEGYSRNGIERLPKNTTRGLVRMANSLMTDLNMPVFNGIFIKIDGFDVMILKEIHMHEYTEAARAQLSAMEAEFSAEKDSYKRKILLKRKKAFSNQHQPHTGISYALKK